MNKVFNQVARYVDEMCGFVATMDSTAWAVISVSSVVAGYMLLKGNTIKGA